MVGSSSHESERKEYLGTPGVPGNAEPQLGMTSESANCERQGMPSWSSALPGASRYFFSIEGRPTCCEQRSPGRTMRRHGVPFLVRAPHCSRIIFSTLGDAAGIGANGFPLASQAETEGPFLELLSRLFTMNRQTRPKSRKWTILRFATPSRCVHSEQRYR